MEKIDNSKLFPPEEDSGKEYYEDLKRACRLYMDTINKILSSSEGTDNESDN